jgi:hypothetical protein
MLAGMPVALFAFNAMALLSVFLICKFVRAQGSTAHTPSISAALRFIRLFYPFFFFLPINEQVGAINRFWFRFEWDAALRLAELFHFAYFTCNPTK